MLPAHYSLDNRQELDKRYTRLLKINCKKNFYDQEAMDSGVMELLYELILLVGLSGTAAQLTERYSSPNEIKIEDDGSAELLAKLLLSPPDRFKCSWVPHRRATV